MEKRYQVFVSSTYADLKAERQRVIQALMEMDCIPAGMELFPAQDEEQWAFIKRVIDDCDYYLLIIGGRYGSLTPDGVSYTEKEFDYASQRGLKAIALLHQEPDSIPVNKSDIDPELRKKLAAFREKVATNRLVKFWKTADELPGMVALSLSKTIKTYPAVGWVRGSSVANEQILIEVNNLRKENSELQTTVAALKSVVVPQYNDIADFDAPFKIDCWHHISSRYGSERHDFNHTSSWRQLFSMIAPYIMTRPTDAAVKTQFEILFAKESGHSSVPMDDQQFKTTGLQFKALQLVTIEYLKTTKGGMGLFWTLTEGGEKVVMNERIIRQSGS
jgi:hypothetical protein